MHPHAHGLALIPRPSKGRVPCARQPRRDGPVEFEQEDNEADPFGLDQFLSEAKEAKKS